MPKTNMARDEFYFSIFVTALEGGIGYWSKAEKYHWALDKDKREVTGNEDLKGFYADVIDFVEHDDPEEWEDREKTPRLHIDRSVIVKGINALARGTATWGGQPLSDKGKARYAKLLADLEGGDVDSDLADNIVQAGLFGDVRYG